MLVSQVSNDKATSEHPPRHYTPPSVNLNRIVLTREGEICDERASTSNLRRELSRVRKEFIVSTSNRSEQQSALIGGHRKGKRAANSWTPRRGQNLGLSLEQSALQGARDMVSWDDVFMTKVNADSPTKANGRHNTGVIGSSGGRQACQQARGTQER